MEYNCFLLLIISHNWPTDSPKIRLDLNACCIQKILWSKWARLEPKQLYIILKWRKTLLFDYYIFQLFQRAIWWRSHFFMILSTSHFQLKLIKWPTDTCIGPTRSDSGQHGLELETNWWSTHLFKKKSKKSIKCIRDHHFSITNQGC